MGVMAGKQGLVMGVANERSLAWGIARAVHAEGGRLAFTYQGEALGRRVRPLAESLGSDFVAEAEPDAPVAGDELEDARWFTREEVGLALRGESPPGGLRLSPSISISRWLVERWYAGETAGVA